MSEAKPRGGGLEGLGLYPPRMLPPGEVNVVLTVATELFGARRGPDVSGDCDACGEVIEEFHEGIVSGVLVGLVSHDEGVQ